MKILLIEDDTDLFALLKYNLESAAALLANHPEIDVLTYLDADLYFYSSPEPIFSEFQGASVLIHEHRYSPELKCMEINGKYIPGDGEL